MKSENTRDDMSKNFDIPWWIRVQWIRRKRFSQLSQHKQTTNNRKGGVYVQNLVSKFMDKHKKIDIIGTELEAERIVKWCYDKKKL